MSREVKDVAVMTTYAEMIFCIDCATWINDNIPNYVTGDITFWLRNLPMKTKHTAFLYPSDEEIRAFARKVEDGLAKDWISNEPEATDKHMKLLQSNSSNIEDEILIKSHCNLCMCKLCLLCSKEDYSSEE